MMGHVSRPPKERMHVTELNKNASWPESDLVDPHQGGAPRGWKIDQLDYPTFRLTLIGKIMDRLTIRYLAERGDITYAEWRAMARLATMRKGGTIGQIADLAWVDKAEVSRAVGQLEAKGFAARRVNPRDRRTPIIFLTPLGQERYDDGIRERVQFHESLLQNFSDKERGELDALLEKIGSRLVQLMAMPLEAELDEA